MCVSVKRGFNPCATIIEFAGFIDLNNSLGEGCFQPSAVCVCPPHSLIRRGSPVGLRLVVTLLEPTKNVFTPLILAPRCCAEQYVTKTILRNLRVQRSAVKMANSYRLEQKKLAKYIKFSLVA